MFSPGGLSTAAAMVARGSVGCPAAGQWPVLGAAPEMNAAGESLISLTDRP